MLAGGDSAEADVSRSSAAAVQSALNSLPRFDARVFELDAELIAALQRWQPAVVFPALHGPPGEDGTVQGLLEMLRLPYVGSGVQASAFAMDKSVAKALFARAGLPLAEDCVYDAADYAPDTAAASIAREIVATLGNAVVIKPMQQGSALGVTPLPDGGDLQAAVTAALALGNRLLVERFVAGRELTVGVLDRSGGAPEALPVIEITTATGEWYDYHNRYTPGASVHLVPAPVTADIGERLQQIALAAHRCLGLADLSRADFILGDDGDIVLLEVNTLPGMTPTSLYPDGAAAAGYPFPALLAELIDSALRRRG